MNKIRLWKLGSLEHNITPTREAVKRLEEALKKNLSIDSDGVVDIVWGPDISIIDIPDVGLIENYVVTKIDHIGTDEIVITARKVNTHE
jgi:hypothetical protein